MAFFAKVRRFLEGNRTQVLTGHNVHYAHPTHAFQQDLNALLSDSEKIQKYILDYLNAIGRNGDNYISIDRAVIARIFPDSSVVQIVVASKFARNNLKVARNALKNKGLIGFNSWTRAWYSREIHSKDLTGKETRFLAAHGLKSGWRRIENKSEVIAWIHQHFTPDQFEHFCISILKTHCGKPMKRTEKRPVSGADGGFDGEGIWEIEGKAEKVMLQVKRIRPDHQLGEDQCDRFAGALYKNNLEHGVYITTGIFSQRFKESVKQLAAKGILIELIDQDRLAEIMLVKRSEPHGFGLHRTDKGLYYINEHVLRQAAC